jgi:hypothetical protein
LAFCGCLKTTAEGTLCAATRTQNGIIAASVEHWSAPYGPGAVLGILMRWACSPHEGCTAGQELSVENFAERFRARIREARNFDQKEEREEEREATDRVQRASQLERHVEHRFLEAAGEEPQSILHRVEHALEGTTHELGWIAPLPARSLLIRVDPDAGQLWWAWVFRGEPTGWTAVDILHVDRKRVDELIALLADQETWDRGEAPAYSFPGEHAR